MSDQTKQTGAVHLSDAAFQTTLDKAGDQPVFVDFYADWCGPCKLAAPIVDKLADEYQGKVVIAKLNVDDNPESAKMFGVMSIPTVIVFKNGAEVDRKIGFPGEQGYREMIGKAGAKTA